MSEKGGYKMNKKFVFGLMIILLTVILLAGTEKNKKNLKIGQGDDFFSICTAFIKDGELENNLQKMAEAEKKILERVKGIRLRRFFQCKTQSQIIWAITQWRSEGLHNTVAQSLMKTRRDDRIASISFGPDPYFEIFCQEQKDLRIGKFSAAFNYIIIGHGLINPNLKHKYTKLQKERFSNIKHGQIPWLRVYINKYNNTEFVFFIGFKNQAEFEKQKKMGEFHLLEYLFTGLTKPFGMSLLAGYNQFVCAPLKFDAQKVK
jgi:hypothetical protein